MLCVVRIIRSSPAARRTTGFVLGSAAVLLLGDDGAVSPVRRAGHRSARRVDAAAVVRCKGSRCALLSLAVVVGVGSVAPLPIPDGQVRTGYRRQPHPAATCATSSPRNCGTRPSNWHTRWTTVASSTPPGATDNRGRQRSRPPPPWSGMAPPSRSSPTGRACPTTTDWSRTSCRRLGLPLDNERLSAQARAQVAELAASQLRIIEAGEAERRRLERDLHDGAQQRLVALMLTLRLARSTTRTAEDARTDRHRHQHAARGHRGGAPTRRRDLPVGARRGRPPRRPGGAGRGIAATRCGCWPFRPGGYLRPPRPRPTCWSPRWPAAAR